MLAEQSLRDGNLDDALTQLQDQVRKDPADSNYRVFLFQLLSVLGSWDRALTQLNVAAEIDPATLMMAQTYREALHCEALRAEVFAGRRTPLIFGEPAQWVALLLEALRLTAEGKHAQSAELRDQAFDGAPATAGTINDEPFEWISDADSRLGPTLEAIINGSYYWVPFDCIQAVDLEEPSDLRDLVWLPAHFRWTNGGDTVGLVPTRYPGSHTSDKPEIRLARRTEWIEQEGELYIGYGQRLLATDAGEHPLMDVRSIRLDTGDGDADDTTSDAG